MSSLFGALGDIFRNAFKRKQREEEWASRFNNPPADGKNKLPLEPEKDPWRT